METIRAMTILRPLLTCFFSMILLSHPMTATAVAAEAVKVSTTPIFREIPLGQARKDFQVLLRVEAPPAAAHRVPIDVVAVLDVSGSMNDRENRPSRLDLLKAAAKFMVAKLDDGDRLAVVAFNDRPVRELSSGLLYLSGDGRRNAMNVVDKLEARGGTALFPALEEAVKILDERPGDGRNRLGFIVLLTDGEDARGFAWRRESIYGDVLGKYPIHAIGLGALHDPEVLLYLAQESHGTYSFVDDESAGELPGALAVCLGGLTTVAAVDTRVVLKAAEPNGVRIDRVDAGGHGTRVGCGGGACDFDVGALYAGETKHFVVHLHVPAASSVEDGYYCDIDLAACDDRHQRRRRHEQHLLAVGYSYRNHPGAAVITTEGHGVFIQRSPDLGSGGVRQPLLLPSPEVLHHIVRFELLDVVAGLVDGELAVVRDRAHAGDLLQLRWEEFRACHQFWGGLDLGGLEKEVDSMAGSLRTGAAAYVYAWVSSHQMQRAASLGSPEKAAAEYLTQAMRVLMEEARKLPRLAETTTSAAAATGPGVQYSGDCADLQMIDRRLELWSKVRRDVQHLMFRPSAAATAAVAEGEGEEDLLAAVFQEASLEAIDRAMHRDIYLAAVYASKQRRCHVGACN
uniref:VWFA domain-containing protein n=1 Tax=Setaria viridis TaxID=4556 RepID=A0A4U6TGI1_SETVI|nr:uncharacterized protein LOC117866428 [Setaria viridis]TKV99882.1 hypothetical protein SEVIR_8G073800v2 [Setaria viridis]